MKTAFMCSRTASSRYPISSRFCSATGRPGLLGQSRLRNVEIHMPRSCRLGADFAGSQRGSAVARALAAAFGAADAAGEPDEPAGEAADGPFPRSDWQAASDATSAIAAAAQIPRRVAPIGWLSPSVACRARSTVAATRRDTPKNRQARASCAYPAVNRS